MLTLSIMECMRLGPLTRHQQDLYFKNPIFAMARLPNVQLPKDHRKKFYQLPIILADLVDVGLLLDPYIKTNIPVFCHLLFQQIFSVLRHVFRLIRLKGPPVPNCSIIDTSLKTSSVKGESKQWKIEKFFHYLDTLWA